MRRRQWCGRGVAALAGVAAAGWLTGCTTVGLREPVRVNLVALDPLPGEGLELRLAVKLRVQNPNDTALDYDGVSLTLDVRGTTFATGVSAERGQVPRFGEAVLTVPASVSAWAAVRQVIGIATAEELPRIDVALRGRLHGVGLGGMPFESSGEIDLPKALGRR